MTTPDVALQYVAVDDWAAYDEVNPPVDADGNIWIWQDIAGWFGGLGVRAEVIPRPMADGDYDGAMTFAGREVTIDGTLMATTPEGLQNGLARLATVLTGDVRLGSLVVNEARRGVRRQISVRLAGPTMISRQGRLYATFSLALYARDSSVYSADPKSATSQRYQQGGMLTIPMSFNPLLHFGSAGSTGLVDVTNAGDVSTWPTFTLVGPLDDPTVRLVGTDGQLTVASATGGVELTAGQTMVLDSYNRSITLDGANRRPWLAPGSKWFSLPPGDSQIYFGAVSGSGTMTISWRDAWS